MVEIFSGDERGSATAHRIIAYDVMRLFIGPSFLTPRGIDRVDLALARHIFGDESSRNIGILPTPAGVYAFSSIQVRRLLAHLQELWAEDGDAASDPQLQSLLDKIARRPEAAKPGPSVSSLAFRDKVRRMLHMLRATGLFPGRFAGRMVPPNSVYLNVGQLGLAMPSFFNWLVRRPDITRAMMLHDAIPIDYPHLVGEKAPMHHRQMIRTAAEHADCLIFNSAYTRDSVTAVMRGIGRTCPPALVRSLPLPAAFVDVETCVAELCGTRYFLAVSTIEPRKNFALLLCVWQRFVATLGSAAPHLVIVGSPGKDADTILAPLRSSPGLASFVHHVVGLSSPALASLSLGAAGMLCPSFAEGFGLPLLEASAMDVPVIATDIPAHREVATPATILLPPDDVEAWARAIAATPDVVAPRRPHILSAMTEAAYCADIIDFVSGIEAGQRARNARRSL
ncbi:glycosyltransferase family 4 protein [Sphingomonas immobilis]|uniref:Glycosyltransferase family 1 protein n=1 Tax=Sphingomonas immobilis TaxID=3063997 RepID=A0ABT9A2Q1_9SPHN|nr:glycosyltransferase family 1 protein [Sphingomonas sp. CA1-15]MDO7843692.1 glycosyltransferase family 1 protein [Sphingomonas sp. CA1-15]